MLKNIIKRRKEKKLLKKLLQKNELNDKQYLLLLASVLDNVEYDNLECIKMTKQFAEDMSYRIRKIGNRMVIK